MLCPKLLIYLPPLSPLVTISCFLVFWFWPHSAALGILVPQPGIEPMPPAVETRSLNHWTTREVPISLFCISVGLFLFCI